MAIITLPTEKMKTLSDDNYRLRRELLVARQCLSSANHRADSLERELHTRSYDITCIPPINMTKQIAEWIQEYQVPWEVLYCTDCKSWMKELDSSFPYHWDGNICNCQGGDYGKG